jgi:channel protein (hemolysin III family)
MPQLPELYHLPGFYDPVSSMSHLFGAVLFAFLGAILLRRGCSTWSRSGYLFVYVLSTVVLFSISGSYHMLERGWTGREVMERLDHDAIYFLIAGTFTPIHGILFRGWLRWGILTVIWGGAILSITLTSVYYDDLPEWVWGILYLAMGWSGLISMIVLGRRYGLRFILPLLAGGIIYSVGAVVDFSGGPTIIRGVVNSHELFHLAILLGAFLHWLFIWKCASSQEASPPVCPPIRDEIAGRMLFFHRIQSR